MEALKMWNQHNSNSTWCIPKMHDPKSGPGWASRTTAEYQEVRDIMKHGTLSKGEAVQKEKQVAGLKSKSFVGRTRKKAQKGMSDAEKAEYEAVMASIRHGKPAAAAAPPAIASSSSSASKLEPRRKGNKITLG